MGVTDHEGESAPGTPNWLDKINAILDFWTDPCDAPLTVYAKTLWPAALHFLWEWYMPDPQNVLVNLFRWRYIIPRTRNRRKGRGGKKSARGPVGRWIKEWIHFDQDEWISRRIANWTELTGRKVSKKFVTLLIVEGVIERLNFWMFVFELVLDLFYSWSSLMKKTTYCQAQGDDVLLADGPDQIVIGIFGWVGINLSHIRKQRGRVTWNYSAGSFGGNTGVVIVSAKVENNGDNNASGVGLRITLWQNLLPAQTFIEQTDIAAHSSTEMTVNCEVSAGARFRVEHGVQAGTVEFKEPVISIHGKGKELVSADP